MYVVQAAHVTQLLASASDKHAAAIRSFQQQAADQADSDAQWQRQNSRGVLPNPLLDWLSLQSGALHWLCQPTASLVQPGCKTLQMGAVGASYCYLYCYRMLLLMFFTRRSVSLDRKQQK